MSQPTTPEKTRWQRWHVAYTHGVGPFYVHIDLGLRIVIASHAFALHIGLIFGELMIQWNRKVPDAD